MNKQTSHTIQISLGRNLVSPAAFVLVAVRNVLAAAICAPLALAVHRLAAARLGALLQSIRVGAGIPVVGSSTLNNVGAALLVRMLDIIVLASTIVAKRTKAIHRLGTALRSALLESLRVRAAVTVVGNIGRNLVDPAALVLVVV